MAANAKLVPQTPEQLISLRIRALHDGIGGVRQTLKTPTFPIYPDEPDDSVETQVAFFGSTPKYFRDGSWHVFGGVSAITSVDGSIIPVDEGGGTWDLSTVKTWEGLIGGYPGGWTLGMGWADAQTIAGGTVGSPTVANLQGWTHVDNDALIDVGGGDLDELEMFDGGAYAVKVTVTSQGISTPAADSVAHVTLGYPNSIFGPATQLLPLHHPDLSPSITVNLDAKYGPTTDNDPWEIVIANHGADSRKFIASMLVLRHG